MGKFFSRKKDLRRLYVGANSRGKMEPEAVDDRPPRPVADGTWVWQRHFGWVRDDADAIGPRVRQLQVFSSIFLSL